MLPLLILSFLLTAFCATGQLVYQADSLDIDRYQGEELVPLCKSACSTRITILDNDDCIINGNGRKLTATGKEIYFTLPGTRIWTWSARYKKNHFTIFIDKAEDTGRLCLTVFSGATTYRYHIANVYEIFKK